jgi:predicted dehydrogenase
MRPSAVILDDRHSARSRVGQMSVAAILGSGFGLYGYLPAIIEAGSEHIILPERYRAKFSTRPELSRFADAIEWVVDEDAALKRADCVITALRPDLQMRWVSYCLQLPNVERLLLEKPLTPTPDTALSLFDNLIDARKIFRIGYIFRLTSWGDKMLRSLSRSPNGNGRDELHITWGFLAHHYRHPSATWKRHQSSGGGALRFYGIQLITLLAELGYKNVSSSKIFGPDADEIVRWSASFSGTGLPDCRVAIDTRATSNEFRIERSGPDAMNVLVNQPDPFEATQDAPLPGELDRRVPLLTRLYRSLWDEQTDTYAWYRGTLDLWSAVENVTLFEATGQHSW